MMMLIYEGIGRKGVQSAQESEGHGDTAWLIFDVVLGLKQ